MESEVGEVEAETGVARLIETATVQVVCWPKESVTVQSAVPPSVPPVESPMAVKVVAEVEGESIETFVPPDCHTQANVYGPCPPVTPTCTWELVTLLVVPKDVTDDGEGVAEGTETRSMLTLTDALEVRSVTVSVTVHLATPV